MQKKGTFHRCVKPSHIENGCGFACSQVIPFSVGPRFHPSMIVVGMRPSGSVNLSGRNSHSAECSHSKRRFLAATAIRRAHRCQRRTCTGIGRPISHFFVTPMVYFENGVIHGKIANPFFQFPVKDHTRRVQILVVYPDGQHKMTKHLFGNVFSPRHFFLRGERLANIIQIKFRRIVGNIAQRHVSIEKFQCFTFAKRILFIGEIGENTGVADDFHFHGEVFFDPLPIVGVRNKMRLFLVASRHHKKNSNEHNRTIFCHDLRFWWLFKTQNYMIIFNLRSDNENRILFSVS